jgi:hypothetical protein
MSPPGFQDVGALLRAEQNSAQVVELARFVGEFEAIEGAKLFAQCVVPKRLLTYTPSSVHVLTWPAIIGE